ncbi:MAG: HAMP domain-containing sensor histidine kinase [Bacteroidia bacterium]
MDQLIEFFTGLFSTEHWPERWSCGTWSQFHGWLYIISSFLIAAAYFVIPVLLYKFLKRRSDLPFIKIFWLFILFILACGSTHLIDGVIFWEPIYRLSAFVLFSTAIVSWFAVIGLVRVMPKALELKSPQQLELIINKRTRQLKETNASLKRINEDLDNYVYAASHDLKSPVNNMEGLIDLLKSDLADNKMPSEFLVEKIEESVKRVQNTIAKLTDVIKLQKSPYDDQESNNLNHLIDEILVDNSQIIEKFDAEIIRELDMDTFFYSKSGLKQILYNLIINSIKYSHPDRKPKIMVRFYVHAMRVCLEVEDNGLGIDLEKYGDRMFVLFKRLHEHVEGSGIGLYSIKQLITKKGGTIKVSSELGKGSKFSVVF